MNKDIKIIEIKSVQEFLDNIQGLKKSGFEKIWFRGIADESYALEPSLYRRAADPTIEKQLLNRFMSRALPFLGNGTEARTYWEWLFIMQHYGVPTRLLDWSDSAVISLAFSVIYRSEKHDGKNAAIWCLEPEKLNKDYVKGLLPTELIPNITDQNVKRIQIYQDETIPVDFPIAVYGPLNNERIVAQKGVFTLFPFKHKFKLEDLNGTENFLVKFVIPEANVKSIKEQLLIMGITENNVYPGLDSIAKEINREILKA